MKKQSIFQTKKFKYGAVSVLFTVVVIAAVIVANVVITALTSKFAVYVDMTGSSLYSVSEECTSMVSELISESKAAETDSGADPLHYEIIFCQPLDELEGTQYSKLIYNLAQKLEAEFPDTISISSLDIITYPTLAEQYKTTSADTVKTTDVIVKSATGYRKYSQEAFYVTASSDNSVFAFNGELKFVSAFLQLAGQYNPVAVFLTGHGEGDSSAMQALFDAAGFDVMELNLQKGSEADGVAAGELPEYAKVVVIDAPQYDYIGDNSDGLVNEIDVINNFLEIKDDGSAGNLMVFMNADTAGKLPELETYLVEWGIQFGQATLKDSASAASADGQTIIATLPTEGLGASLHTDLRALSSMPVTIVKNACPIYQLYTSKNNRTVSSVLTTTKTAEAYPANGEGDVVRGQFDLMTLARETRYIDNEPCYAYVLVASSTNFGDSTYMAQRSYGNSDILFAAMKAFGKTKVPVNIDFKVLGDTGLSISTAQANGWTAALVTVVPIAMLIAGIVVYIRRKHL